MTRPRSPAIVETRLPLASGNSLDFIKNFSSDDFNKIVCQGLFAGDMVTTYWARYPWLIQSIMGSGDFGGGINCTFHNPVVAAGIWSAIFVLAMANIAREIQTQQAAKSRNSYTKVYGKLKSLDPSEAEPSKPIGEMIAEWNGYLKRVLDRDQRLKDKYESAAFENTDASKTELVFKRNKSVKSVQENTEDDNSENTVKPPTQPVGVDDKWYNRFIFRPLNSFKESRLNKKMITPLVDGTFLCAFTYWILWGNTIALTENITDTAAGLSVGVGFGIPFTIGGLYFLQKGVRFLYHKAWKSKSPEETEKEEQEKTAKEDAVCLLRQAIALKKFEDSRRKLMDLLPPGTQPAFTKPEGSVRSDMDKKIASLQDNKFAKSALGGFTDFVSYYGVIQYIAWVITDFLTKINVVTVGIPVVNLVVGCVLIGWSAIHSVVKFAGDYYTRQQAADKAKNALEEAAKVGDTLEAQYQQTLQQIRQLKVQYNIAENDDRLPKLLDVTHPQFFGDELRSGSLAMSNTKKTGVAFLEFINAITTGAFLARLFTIKGSAIALSVACFTFANPVFTLAAVFGFGVLFAGIKVVEHIQLRKEAEAKEALAKRSERVEYLKDQLELAKLTKQVLEDPGSREKLRVVKVAASGSQSKVVRFPGLGQKLGSIFGGPERAANAGSTATLSGSPVSSKTGRRASA